MGNEEIKTRISFQDFLEQVEADDRRFHRLLVDRLVSPIEKTPPISQTHIFHLGDNETIVEALMPIRDDIAADCNPKVPMPFDDVSCVSTVIAENERHWIFDRIINEPAFRQMDPPEDQGIKERGWTVRQHLFMMRYTELNRKIFGPSALPSMWDVWFCGTEDGKYQTFCCIDRVFQVVAQSLFGKHSDPLFVLSMRETSAILEQLAAISHPQNYLVKVVPTLTPREERQVSQGRPRPVRKSPHFIVVDHDVLVRMSQGHYGTHASPVPHERRGHWRRLAERCRHAKLLGKDRVFVRPTYVGERNFSDEKNHYEVLMDFEKKEVAS